MGRDLPSRTVFVRIEILGREPTDLGVLAREPPPALALALVRPLIEAQRAQRRQAPAHLDDVLLPLLRTFRARRGRAQARAEVDEVVPDEAPAALLDVAVERVEGAGVQDREPGEQEPARAQRAALLVRDPVVGIVGPPADHVEGAHDLARAAS